MSIADERKSQEDMENSIQGGYYKSLVKFQKAMFDEYVLVGFTREEALQLVLMIMGNKQ